MSLIHHLSERRTLVGDLSRREQEVLRLMAKGYSNQGICERLFLSPKTVESHVRSIFMKLNLRGQPETNRRVLAVLSYIAGASAGHRLVA